MSLTHPFNTHTHTLISQGIENISGRDVYTPMFTAALFIMAKR